MDVEQWPELIPVVQMVLNVSPVKSLAGYSPSEVAFGQHVPLPTQVVLMKVAVAEF